MSALLEAHLAQALALNAVLGGRDGTTACAPAEVQGRALMLASGALLHATSGFAELLRAAGPRLRGARLPLVLARRLLRGETARPNRGGVEITPVRLGDVWLLVASRGGPLAGLSAREQGIARRFGAGHSYRAIATELQLAPATVRNVVQNIYRKLGIHGKADLAGLLVEEEHTGAAHVR